MKTLLSRFALAVSFIGSCALVSVTPAKAITWNLSNPSGEQSTSNTLTSTTGGYTLGTAGFTYTGAFASFTAVDTYGKVTSGDATETGLGLGNKATGALVDPTGDHEIVTNSLVRIDTTTARTQGLGSFTFTMGSTTQGEAWSVYGSTAANSTLVSLYSNYTTQCTSGSCTHYALSDLYNFFYFVYTGPTSTCGGCNVLLTDFSGSVTSINQQGVVPLPAALPLFASGLVGLGVLGWRRKKKAQTVAA